jgi:hypothetical protein
MKKTIVSLVVLCMAFLSSGVAMAQGRWGVTLGADLTNLVFDQKLFKVNYNVGVTAGVTGELMMPGIGFGFDAAVLYTQRGAGLHLGDKPLWASQGYGKENCMLHYLEIPIHFKFKYKNLDGFENTLMPIIFVGPEFSFLMGHNDLKAMNYPGGEFGLDVGLGAEIFRKFQVNASYTWGLSYCIKTKQLDDFIGKNRTWKLTCTYFF